MYYRKYQEGGEAVPQEQLSAAKVICALVGWAASQDLDLSLEEAQEYIEKLAEESPEALKELQESDDLVEAGALILQENEPEAFLELIANELELQQAQQVVQARRGMKLNYLKSLKGQCPDGYDTIYLRRGGSLCPVCQKKAAMKKKKKLQQGGLTPELRKAFIMSGLALPMTAPLASGAMAILLALAFKNIKPKTTSKKTPYANYPTHFIDNPFTKSGYEKARDFYINTIRGNDLGFGAWLTKYYSNWNNDWYLKELYGGKGNNSGIGKNTWIFGW